MFNPWNGRGNSWINFDKINQKWLYSLSKEFCFVRRKGEEDEEVIRFSFDVDRQRCLGVCLAADSCRLWTCMV